MRKILQLILIAIIACVSGHIFVSNVEHIIYLNTKAYTYDFQDNSVIKNINSSIQNIENNLVKMEKLKNSYLSSEELSNIKKTINRNLEIAKNLPFLAYDSTHNVMKEAEFYRVIKATQEFEVSGLVAAYKTIAKYNEKIDADDFVQTAFMQLVYPDFIARGIIENYKYSASTDEDLSVGLKPLALINYVAVKLNTVENISNLVLESGDISE